MSDDGSQSETPRELADVGRGTTAECRRFIPEFSTDRSPKLQGAFRHRAVAFYGNPASRIATKFLVSRMLDIPFTRTPPRRRERAGFASMNRLRRVLA
jgi:hypothetical protein